MAALQGYRTQQKIGQSQYQTYQQVGRAGSGSYAADTVSKVLWDTTPLNVPVEAGSTRLIINATAHTALAGDMLRFTSTSANPGIEVGVVKVTANTIELGGELPALPLLADEFKIMRWITPVADQNGNLVFTPGPTTYNRNGSITTVAEDTANAANNRGLPVLPTYYRNGVPVTVNIDTVTPANNRGLPVELVSVTGSVTINAGDLNVSTNATNDSMAIGDGITGNRARVLVNNDATTFALKVKDDDANTTLTSVSANTLAVSNTTGNAGSAIAAPGVSIHGSDGTLNRKLLTNASGQLQVGIVASTLPTGAATLTEQQTQTTRLTSIRDALELIDNSTNLDGNPIGAAGLSIGGRDGSGNFQQVAVNTAGEVSVTFGSAGFSTETTLSALNNKVAQNFGAAAGAVRTAAQLGNAGGPANFNAGIDDGQTLRVSANLKRNGNELSYASGVDDANTQRVTLSTRHETVTTPVAARLSSGTAFITDGSIAGNAQYTIGTSTNALKTASYSLGFDGTLHREFSVDTAGRVRVLPETPSLIATVKQAAVTFGTTAIRLTTDGLAPTATRKSLKFIIEPPAGDVNFFLGSATVTSSGATRGIRLYPGTMYDYGADGNDYYIISDTASQTVFVLEVE
jgi:hypothetical protein